MYNSTELVIYRIGLSFLFCLVCANLSHLRHSLGAALRSWVTEAGWCLSPTRAACLEGTQAGRVLSGAPHLGVSSGALLGNQRVSLHNCKLRINKRGFFHCQTDLWKKKNQTPNNHVYTTAFVQPLKAFLLPRGAKWSENYPIVFYWDSFK